MSDHRTRRSVLYYFEHSLTNPIPRLHGTRQMEILAADRPITVVSVEPHSRSDEEERRYRKIRDSLDRHGVRHIAIPKSSSSVRGMLRGARVLFREARKGRADILHCRSYRPSVSGWLVSMLTGSKLLFDMRGLFVDEYLFAGAFKKGSAKYRIGRWLERRLLAYSHISVAVSERYREHLLQRPDLRNIVDPERLVLIYSRTEVARFAPVERDRIRRELGWEECTIGVFSGSSDQWHRFDQIVDIANRVAESVPRARFLFLIHPDAARAREIAADRGLSEDRAVFTTLPSSDVPQWLAACDFSFMVAEKHLIREISGPIKFAEYMAAGLPVIAGGGLGDPRTWIRDEGLGIVIDPDDMETAATRALEMLKSPSFLDGTLAEKCRVFARQHLDMPQTTRDYARVYELLDRQ